MIALLVEVMYVYIFLDKKKISKKIPVPPDPGQKWYDGAISELNIPLNMDNDETIQTKACLPTIDISKNNISSLSSKELESVLIRPEDSASSDFTDQSKNLVVNIEPQRPMSEFKSVRFADKPWFSTALPQISSSTHSMNASNGKEIVNEVDASKRDERQDSKRRRKLKSKQPEMMFRQGNKYILFQYQL